VLEHQFRPLFSFFTAQTLPTSVYASDQDFLDGVLTDPVTHVFVGLFIGLGASFPVLVVAEMLGVKAGLGWYLQWAQGWAAYANMYAALLVMALMCSGLITLLFRTRDRLLAWQKGLVKW
jgi:ABC-type nitrate/sulfonate/bicarbonate transport system permease component